MLKLLNRDSKLQLTWRYLLPQVDVSINDWCDWRMSHAYIMDSDHVTNLRTDYSMCWVVSHRVCMRPHIVPSRNMTRHHPDSDTAHTGRPVTATFHPRCILCPCAHTLTPETHVNYTSWHHIHTIYKSWQHIDTIHTPWCQKYMSTTHHDTRYTCQPHTLTQQ